ncbi:MAG: electron transfer flavoprotein subunit beta, partial [Synergistaceae bacterium]|nr:electron transfer flavoprotein subunit beta [Synergistaceae bacterium]
SPLPAMVIPVKEMNIPRLCTLSGKLRAKKTEIPVLNAEDLGLDEESTGLKGSATWVINVTYPQMTRQGRKISSSGRVNEAVKTIMEFLEDKNCLGAVK